MLAIPALRHLSTSSRPHAEGPLSDAPSREDNRETLPVVGIFVAAVLLFSLVRWAWSGFGLAGVAAAEWVAFLGLPLFLLHRLGEQWKSAIGFGRATRRAVMGGAVLGMAGAPVAWLAHALQSLWFEGDHLTAEAIGPEFLAGGAGGAAAVFVLAVVTPAICEETLFRGVLLRGLERNWGSGPAIISTAFVFGAVHWVPGGAVRVLPVAAVGCILGWAAVRGGSLVVAMVAHLVHNLLIVGGALMAPEWGGRITPAFAILAGVAFLLLGSQLLNGGRGSATGSLEPPGD